MKGRQEGGSEESYDDAAAASFCFFFRCVADSCSSVLGSPPASLAVAFCFCLGRGLAGRSPGSLCRTTSDS